MPDVPEVHGSSNAPLPSPRKPACTKRKVFLAVVLVLLALIGFTSFQKQVLKKRVETRRRELIAQGEKLTLAELAPKRSETNNPNDGGGEYLQAISSLSRITTIYNPLQRAPYVAWRGTLDLSYTDFAVSLNWTSSLGFWMETHLPANQVHLNRMIQATDRPEFSFDIDYENGLNRMKEIDNTTLFNSVGWLQQAMYYHLQRGNPAEALRLLRAQIRLLRLRADGDSLFLHINRAAIGLTADESTWQALQYPGWNDSQLAELQRNWESVEFIPAMEHALAEHRARSLELIAALRRDFEPYGPVCFDLRKPRTGQHLIVSLMSNPGAWADYCKKRYLQYWSWKNSDSFHDELCVMNATEAALGVVRSLRSDPRDFATTMSALKSALLDSNLESTHSKHFINTPRVASALLSCTLCAETKRQLAITAIAIKRYQLAHGRLPDSLADLVPAFLSKPILDPMDGKPLRYRPRPDGTFQLYSVGFDGKDNGGTGGSWDSLEEGTDLVWPFPARP